MNRRRLISGAASVVGVLGLAPALARLAWDTKVAPRAARQLAGTLRHPASAAQVGWAYLQQHPAEAQITRLVDGLIGGWDAGAGWLERAGRGEVRLRLRAQSRADFAARRTVRVQGWVLAQTEARLFGLAALSAG